VVLGALAAALATSSGGEGSFNFNRAEEGNFNQAALREAGGLPLLVEALALAPAPAPAKRSGSAGAGGGGGGGGAAGAGASGGAEGGGEKRGTGFWFARETVTLAAEAICAAAEGSDPNRNAVREAGGIERLVALLAAGDDADGEASGVGVAAAHDSALQALHNATAGALNSLATDNAENRGAIRRAGGIERLVLMLSGGGRQQD
jgi:hypothetical protein